MNHYPFFIYGLPAILGFAVVMQSGLNRKIASVYSFPVAALVNSLVLTSLGVLIYTLHRRMGESSEAMGFGEALRNFNWWYVVPGMCGFALIMGLPYSLSRIGALKTFLVLLVSQIVFSIVWDALMEAQPVTWPKIIGSAIAMIGILVVILNK